MAKITWKAGTMLSPLPPALISCGTMQEPNVMTAAWTGIICTQPTLAYVSIRPSRYSHDIIQNSREFVINVPNAAMAKAVDWCGVKSGKNVNKFEKTGLTAEKCSLIDAPQIKQAPISLECKVKQIIPCGSHDMFLAEVVAVDVDEKYIGPQGELDLEKAQLLAYAHGFYYVLGKKIGKFGWSVEKKSTIKKRLARQKEQGLQNSAVPKKGKKTWKTKKSK